MNQLFLKTINMSISASWLILAVLIFRLVLKRAPKWVNVLLWGIVAVRLLFPFSIESALSLIPSAETISPDIMMDAAPMIHTGIPAINSAVNPIISQSFAPAPGASANPLQIWIPVFAVVWMFGVAFFLVYTAVTYWHLRRKVGTAVLFRNNIFQSENVSSPFVLGIIRPRIYLPFKIDGQNMEHVVSHELAHIRRKDHWWKPLGFLLLTIHWFNPLMWLAYVLLCRDIELACDERVIKGLGNEQRADYTQALLACSVNRRMIAACPLAFGEVGVKERVRSVMNYKKPALWIIIAAIIASITVAVCFLTNPKTPKYESGIVPGTAIIYTDYDGVYLSAKSIGTNEDGHKVFNIVWHNETSQDITYGEMYSIEYKDGNEWKDVVNPEDIYFFEIGYLLRPYSTEVKSYSTLRFNLPENGTYRLGSHFSNSDGSQYNTWVEFEIGAVDNSEQGNSVIPEDFFDNDVEMIPTTANVQGAFDTYLYVPLGDSTYRYELLTSNTSSVTVGELLYSFTENADPFDVEWNVYEVKESPDHRIVYVATENDYIQLYQYSPSKRVDSNALQSAKENGCIVMEDGNCTWGAKQWEEFYEMTQNGKSRSVKLAHYWTLNPDNCDKTYYEVHKEDYPSMYVLDLVYDGKTFTLSWTEQGVSYQRQYKYLMKYEGTLSAKMPQTATRYVLTNDNTVTWDDLLWGLLSSQYGDYIDHFSIYTDTEIENK